MPNAIGNDQSIILDLQKIARKHTSPTQHLPMNATLSEKEPARRGTKKQEALGLKFVNWLENGGQLDYSMISIRGNIQDALSDDLETSAQGCQVLGSVSTHGRLDAVIFLLGLLTYYRDDLKRLEAVVEALGFCRIPIVADALFGEIARLKGSNQTRSYLNVTIKKLSWFPKEMVADRFLKMSEDTKNSTRMRAKFRAVAEKFFPELRDDGDDDWDW